MLGEPGRSPVRADRHQHGIAVEHAGGGEVAQLGPVDHVDQQSGASQAQRLRFGRPGVVERDEGQPRAARDSGLRVPLDEAARALDQAPLGFGRRPFPQHDDRLAGHAMEERQRAHYSIQSGTRSAAVISSGRMRSATTANLSPSTITSATKPREL